MNLPELCIRRPVMTTLLMAALVIFGIIAYRALLVSELPSVDFPTISVTANLPGASPETMAAASHHLSNEGTLQELYDQIDKVVAKIQY